MTHGQVQVTYSESKKTLRNKLKRTVCDYLVKERLAM